MDARRFTEIKTKLEKLKTEYNMAEGAKAEVMKSLEASYGVNSADKLDQLILDTKELITAKEEEQEAHYEKLLALTDWSVL